MLLLSYYLTVTTFVTAITAITAQFCEQLSIYNFVSTNNFCIISMNKSNDNYNIN